MLQPFLSQAKAPLTSEIEVVNEHGERQQISIPAERALTVYVDKRELVTLMTLGAHPELLVLGYLRNQRLVRSVDDIESITVDWDVGAAAVKTRFGIDDIEEKTAHRVVTTGCGQGSVFGGLMDEVDQIALPVDAAITQGQLYSLVNTIRLKETTYKSAGSVHACALFSTASDAPEMLLFVEDVGRHNAIDAIAGWMWVNMAPTLVASRTALPPEGAELAWGGPALRSLAPTLVASRTALPPEGAELAWGGPALRSLAPTLVTSRTALPPEGALRLRPGEAGSAAPTGAYGQGLDLAHNASSLAASRPAVPPEGMPRLQPGEAGSAAPVGESGEGRALAGKASVPAPSPSSGLVFYTTGRLTSEMVIKSAQMGVPIVVSRSGITQMGHEVAESVGLCAIGRATNKRFLCYSGAHRLKLEAGLVAKPEFPLESYAANMAESANSQGA